MCPFYLHKCVADFCFRWRSLHPILYKVKVKQLTTAAKKKRNEAKKICFLYSPVPMLMLEKHKKDIIAKLVVCPFCFAFVFVILASIAIFCRLGSRFTILISILLLPQTKIIIDDVLQVWIIRNSIVSVS